MMGPRWQSLGLKYTVLLNVMLWNKLTQKLHYEKTLQIFNLLFICIQDNKYAWKALTIYVYF